MVLRATRMAGWSWLTLEWEAGPVPLGGVIRINAPRNPNCVVVQLPLCR